MTLTNTPNNWHHGLPGGDQSGTSDPAAYQYAESSSLPTPYWTHPSYYPAPYQQPSLSNSQFAYNVPSGIQLPPQPSQPSPFVSSSLGMPPPFGETGQANIPQAHAANKGKRKAAASTERRPAKKGRSAQSQAKPTECNTRSRSMSPVAEPCGAGPSREQGSTPDESTHAHSSVFPADAFASHSHGPEVRSNTARDVWYFVRPLEAEDIDKGPSELPEDNMILTCKPKSPYGLCRLCKNHKRWKIGDGSVSTIRAHLKNHHTVVWEGYRRTLDLTDARTTGKLRAETSSLFGDAESSFTMEGFIERLMRWVVVDDQAINEVECDEFRDLIAYVGQGSGLSEDDIPGRTKLTKLLFMEYKKEYGQLCAEMKDSLGRISLTSDLWTDPNRRSFMAMTAHWCVKDPQNRLSLRSCLLAFRHVQGYHDGENIGNIFFDILNSAGIAHKVGQITMDNASNCDTTMRRIAQSMQRKGIRFNGEGNRVRCFPHVVNLAVQAILAELKRNPSQLLFSTECCGTDLDDTDKRSRYVQALENDPVGRTRNLVSVCRASGQRRSDLRKVIETGNTDKLWFSSDGQEIELPTVQLLRDCETRWSSTYLMIERLLVLYPALENFFSHPKQSSLAHNALDEDERRVLQDIYQILEVPHTAQELLSAEKTPTISLTLPVLEMLVETWEDQKRDFPHLSHYIQIGIKKLNEYISKARKTQVHALGMVLNPAMKFDWIEQHWSTEDSSRAREWVFDVMLEFRQAQRAQQGATAASTARLCRTSTHPLDTASQAQKRGLARLASLRRSASNTPASSRASSPVPNSVSNGAEIDAETRERDAAAADRLHVECELRRYQEDGVLSADNPYSNPMMFWDLNKANYPLLYLVALDILPVQASSVSCERVFSSSKETCTQRRACMSPQLIEILQVLKFIYKQDRLDFGADWLAVEDDYCIEGAVTERAVTELLQAGKVEELEDLYRNWGASED